MLRMRRRVFSVYGCSSSPLVLGCHTLGLLPAGSINRAVACVKVCRCLCTDGFRGEHQDENYRVTVWLSG